MSVDASPADVVPARIRGGEVFPRVDSAALPEVEENRSGPAGLPSDWDGDAIECALDSLSLVSPGGIIPLSSDILPSVEQLPIFDHCAKNFDRFVIPTEECLEDLSGLRFPQVDGAAVEEPESRLCSVIALSPMPMRSVRQLLALPVDGGWCVEELTLVFSRESWIQCP